MSLIGIPLLGARCPRCDSDGNLSYLTKTLHGVIEDTINCKDCHRQFRRFDLGEAWAILLDCKTLREQATKLITRARYNAQWLHEKSDAKYIISLCHSLHNLLGNDSSEYIALYAVYAKLASYFE